MERIPDGSIDLMLTDPPYNTIACDWDKPINLDELWKEWERIIKPNGVWAFTATQPFATDLIMSKRVFFKYELIWEKNSFTNFMQAKRMPMRNHENILIFYRKQPTFNPQLKQVQGRGKSINKKSTQIYNIGGKKSETYNSKRKPGLGISGSVIFIKNEKETYNSSNGSQDRHPSQKPVNLMRYIIRMYTNKDETVFDGYAGSGTTAIACIEEKRNFIGSELDKKYFNKAAQMIKIEQMQLKLF